MITKEQYNKLLEVMKEHMQLDDYGWYNISNIYFDTPSFLLIRNSLDKPNYKEKLRVRSYGAVTDDQKVFIEIKKKYDGVVYKRRITTTKKQAFDYLVKGKELAKPSQISKELDYLLEHYENLEPAVFLAYEREGYFGNVDPELRVTFDHNIRMRNYDISLSKENYGDRILDENLVLLEVKTPTGLPFWLVNFFSENKIYKASFSKYGTGYKKFILPKMIEELHEASNDLEFRKLDAS
ncbi:MAG: polyphosphate polymerase domain-containing protein [bacterium]